MLESYIKKLDEDALVVFDVDFTLLVPNDQLLSPSGEAHYLKFLQKIEGLQMEGEILGSRILQHYKVSLVDPKMITLLNELKQKKIKTIALTAMDAGQFGLIPSMEDWRLEQLTSLGIDFSWVFPDVDSFVIEGFNGKRSVPVFKGGILASSKYSKGQVLLAFLKRMQCRPSEIVFVDDRMQEIDSVESELEQERIKHTSFYYTVAANRAAPLNQRLVDFQIDYLFQFKEWLSDEEAQFKIGVEAEPAGLVPAL